MAQGMRHLLQTPWALSSFSPRNLHAKRRELTPTGCHMTNTLTRVGVPTLTHEYKINTMQCLHI